MLPILAMIWKTRHLNSRSVMCDWLKVTVTIVNTCDMVWEILEKKPSSNELVLDQPEMLEEHQELLCGWFAQDRRIDQIDFMVDTDSTRSSWMPIGIQVIKWLTDTRDTSHPFSVIITLVYDRLNSIETVSTVWVSASFFDKVVVFCAKWGKTYQKLPNGRIKEEVHFRKGNYNH